MINLDELKLSSQDLVDERIPFEIWDSIDENDRLSFAKGLAFKRLKCSDEFKLVMQKWFLEEFRDEGLSHLYKSADVTKNAAINRLTAVSVVKDYFEGLEHQYNSIRSVIDEMIDISKTKEIPFEG
jgi:hypothetical protein